MRQFVLFLLCCLPAVQLRGDPVNFTITSLTAMDVGGGPLVSFFGSGSSDSGDSINISGNWGITLPGPVFFGEPEAAAWPFDLNCQPGPDNCNEGAFGTSGARSYDLELIAAGQVLVSGASADSIRASASTVSYFVPVTAAGEFTAVCFQSPNCADGTLFGNVFINLSGVETVTYDSLGFGEYKFDNASFVSTPEPRSSALLWFGGVVLACAAGLSASVKGLNVCRN